MKITIELKSGKKLELTEDEVQEIMLMFGGQKVTPMPIYPMPMPVYPPSYPSPYPYITC